MDRPQVKLASTGPKRSEGHYGTIKLVGVTAEQLAKMVPPEEDIKPAPRRTVEDIASLMQTSQRSQNKGKKSFWEKNSEKKAEKERKKKEAKRQKKELKVQKKTRSNSTNAPLANSIVAGPVETLPSSLSKSKPSERDVGGITRKKEHQQAASSGGRIERLEADSKPEIRIDVTRVTEAKSTDLKKKNDSYWKSLTSRKKKGDDDEVDSEPAPSPPQSKSGSNSMNSLAKYLTGGSLKKQNKDIIESKESLSTIASNLESLERDLHSSSSSDSDSSSDVEMSPGSKEDGSYSSEEDVDPHLDITPGVEVTILQKVGTGATATVWKAEVLGKELAIKQISLKSLKLGNKSGELICKKEYDLVRGLNHPNVIKYYGILFNQKENEVNLFMEYATGSSLTDLILYSKRLSSDLVAYILGLLLDGLIYLHQNFILHRDMKPDNVLLTTRGGLKIIDFGTFAKDTSDKARQRSTVGTPWYCAPEIINGEDYCVAADIWSIGCLTFEMVSGKPPFEELNDIACLFKMAEGVPPAFPKDLSTDTTAFLNACLASRWQERPTAKELKDHALLTSHSTKVQSSKQKLKKVVVEMQCVKSSFIKKHNQRLTQRIERG